MKKAKENRLQTANEFVNVKDIKRKFLYTKDGYVMVYLRIYPYNLDLLSQEERRAKAAALAASFDGDRKDFVYFTFPREIDLDKYKNTLKNIQALVGGIFLQSWSRKLQNLPHPEKIMNTSIL